MADRNAQGALALTSLSTTSTLDAAAKADRTATALRSMFVIGGAETGNAALVSLLKPMRMAGEVSVQAASVGSSLNERYRMGGEISAGKIEGAMATTSQSTIQEAVAKPSVRAGIRPESPQSVSDATTGLEAEHASRASGLRAGMRSFVIAQAQSAALNSPLRIRSVSGYGQLETLGMTIEDALEMTVDVEDAITLSLDIEG
jgi:hypothetical protein